MCSTAPYIDILALDYTIRHTYSIGMPNRGTKDECPSCSSWSYQIVSMSLVNDTHYTRRLQCRSCHKEWDVLRSLVSRSCNGYVMVSLPGRKGFTQLHRWVWEQYHKAKLQPGDIVHHLNANMCDNRPVNLHRMESKHSAFIDIHGLQDRIRELENTLKELECQLRKAQKASPEY